MSGCVHAIRMLELTRARAGTQVLLQPAYKAKTIDKAQFKEIWRKVRYGLLLPVRYAVYIYSVYLTGRGVYVCVSLPVRYVIHPSLYDTQYIPSLYDQACLLLTVYPVQYSVSHREVVSCLAVRGQGLLRLRDGVGGQRRG
jgi:hypothetical protein